MTPKIIFVTNKTNIRYFSGFSGTAGWLALRGKQGWLFTDARYHLVAKAVLPAGFRVIDTTDGFEKPWQAFLKKYRVRQLGVEGGSLTLRFFKRLKKISNRPSRSEAKQSMRPKGATFRPSRSEATLLLRPEGATLLHVKLVDIGEKLSERRMVKKPYELKYIARAQKITDVIFSILKKWLKPGVSEKSIAWKIEAAAHELGADDISFTPIVGINEHSASPHHHNTDRKLKRGDLILIDMGVIYRGYCSDMTRVLFTNTPTAKQAAIYQLVLEAQKSAIAKIRAGITGQQADNFARSLIQKAGYGKYFGHSLGHGVGLDIHELPNLSQKYKGKIPAGSVVTVEPGVYLPGKFGVRLEDVVVVGHRGARNLTRSPKAIQECVIRI